MRWKAFVLSGTAARRSQPLGAACRCAARRAGRPSHTAMGSPIPARRPRQATSEPAALEGCLPSPCRERCRLHPQDLQERLLPYRWRGRRGSDRRRARCQPAGTCRIGAVSGTAPRLRTKRRLSHMLSGADFSCPCLLESNTCSHTGGTAGVARSLIATGLTTPRVCAGRITHSSCTIDR
jgi:hypothetical protein